MNPGRFSLSPWAEEASIVSKLDEQVELTAQGDIHPFSKKLSQYLLC
jgi:hypothetical protein